MFPPLVRFSWKRQKENGALEDLPPAEGEQLELRESGRAATILLVNQDALHTYKYHCHVRHQGDTVTVQAQTQAEAPAPVATCPPEIEPTDPPALQPMEWAPLEPVPAQFQVKQLCLLYTVLTVKSLVYCCGLALLMSLRNKRPTSSCAHAD